MNLVNDSFILENFLYLKLIYLYDYIGLYK